MYSEAGHNYIAYISSPGICYYDRSFINRTLISLLSIGCMVDDLGRSHTLRKARGCGHLDPVSELNQIMFWALSYLRWLSPRLNCL